MPLRCLLDENLRGPLWAALERANARRKVPALEIACIAEESDLPLGTADQDILRWADERGFVLLSADFRTMPQHLAAHLQAGLHCPGVFLVALPCPISLLLEALFYYAEDPADNLWRNQITFIP